VPSSNGEEKERWRVGEKRKRKREDPRVLEKEMRGSGGRIARWSLV